MYEQCTGSLKVFVTKNTFFNLKMLGVVPLMFLLNFSTEAEDEQRYMDGGGGGEIMQRAQMFHMK